MARCATPWLRHWELWLALALAAFLRLWHIELTQFLKDQADLYGLARAAVPHGALPITSNQSSIATAHPPLTIFFLLPFAAVTANPLPAVVSIALLNVAAVGLTYVFSLHYFGRLSAACAALLFATSNPLIDYSRFLWQPNYTAPVALLAVIALYRGAVVGRRDWLVAGIVLALAAVLVHPANVYLAPVALGAVLVAPVQPRRRAWAAGGLIALLLLFPSLLYAVLSDGGDLRVYLQPAHGSINLQIVRVMGGLFGGLTPLPPNVAGLLLFACGALWLTLEVTHLAFTIWREGTGDAGTPARWRQRLAALWRGLRAQSLWRAYLLLWLWVFAPLVLLLRHTEDLTLHYLLFLAPGVFIVQGLGVRWLVDLLGAAASRITGRIRLPVATARMAALALLALVGLLVAGQAERWTLVPATFASGNFDAYQGYGFPLAELQAADAQLTRLQRDQGAAAAYIVTPPYGHDGEAFNYLLAGGRADRVAFVHDCLLLPGPGDGAALVVTAEPKTPAADLLAALPSARRVAGIHIAGGAPFGVYRAESPVPPLAGERAVAPVTFADAATGTGLRLEAAASAGPGLARLRWTVLDPPTPTAGDAQPLYRIELQAGGGAASHVDCQPTRLRPGETLFTWVPVPEGADVMGAGAAIELRVLRGTAAVDLRQIGPLRVITGQPGGSPPVALPYHADVGAAGGAVIAAYPLPTGVLAVTP